jgi:hypothetical protein
MRDASVRVRKSRVQFLTIIDARELYPKVLYAIRAVGTAPAQLVLIIE